MTRPSVQVVRRHRLRRKDARLCERPLTRPLVAQGQPNSPRCRRQGPSPRALGLQHPTPAASKLNGGGVHPLAHDDFGGEHKIGSCGREYRVDQACRQTPRVERTWSGSRQRSRLARV